MPAKSWRFYRLSPQPVGHRVLLLVLVWFVLSSADRMLSRSRNGWQMVVGQIWNSRTADLSFRLSLSIMVRSTMVHFRAPTILLIQNFQLWKAILLIATVNLIYIFLGQEIGALIYNIGLIVQLSVAPLATAILIYQRRYVSY